MFSQVFLSSLQIILTILEFLLAGYIFLLNSKSTTHRALAILLFIFGVINLSGEVLRVTFTSSEAGLWLFIHPIAIYMVGPAIYLSQVYVLRPSWVKKYPWIFRPVIFWTLFPFLVVLLDISGISRVLFSAPLLFTYPDPITYLNNGVPNRILSQGQLHPIFVASQIGFPILATLCPVLVVAWRDRQKNAQLSRIAWVFFIVNVLSAFLQIYLSNITNYAITTLFASLSYLLGLGYITQELLDFRTSYQELQKRLGSLTVFVKLNGSTLIVTIFTIIAITFVNLTTLRNNAVQTISGTLRTFLVDETQEINDLLIREIEKLQEITRQSDLISSLIAQNDQFDAEQAAATSKETQQNELEWQTSETSILREKYLEPNAHLFNYLTTFQGNFPENRILAVYDRFGNFLVSSNLPEQYNVSSTTWWQTASKNQSGIFYVSNPIFDATTSSYFLEIAVPIFSEDQETGLGVLYVQYNFKNILDSLDYQGQGTKTGGAVLFNSIGLLIPSELNQIKPLHRF